MVTRHEAHYVYVKSLGRAIESRWLVKAHHLLKDQDHSL